MSERTERFEITGPPRLVLRVPSGEIRVVAGRAGEAVVRCRGDERHLRRVVVERVGDTITVGPEGGGFGHLPSIDVEIAVGAAPEVRARFGSADLVLHTTVRSLEASGASGDVQAETVEGPLTVRLASGNLEVGTAGDRCDAVTASGRVRVQRASSRVEVKTASGDIVIGEVDGDCSLRTVSGRILVSRFGGSRFEAKAVSGDVRLGLPAGRRYGLSLQTLSGDLSTDFPVSAEAGAAPARVAVTSVSGDIRIAAAS